MKIYFDETGGGPGEIYLTAYVSPREHDDGYEGFEYDLFGKRHEFAWVDPDTARVFDSKELPRDMLYSFKHGVNEFTIDESKQDSWQLSDLRYEKVDKKKVQSSMKGMKLIDECKTSEDVFDVWRKYIKGNYLPFYFVQKGMEIIGQSEIPMQNGELGMYGAMNSLAFTSIMNEMEAQATMYEIVADLPKVFGVPKALMKPLDSE